MHNYAGDPTQFPVNVGLIDDSDSPNASNTNVAPENLADRTAWLKANVGTVGLQWRPLSLWDTINPSTPRFMPPTWDGFAGRWLQCWGTGSATVTTSVDGILWGTLFTESTTPANISQLVAVQPSNGNLIVLASGSTPTTYFYSEGPGGGLVAITSPAQPWINETGAGGTLTGKYYQGLHFGVNWVVWEVGGSHLYWTDQNFATYGGSWFLGSGLPALGTVSFADAFAVSPTQLLVFAGTLSPANYWVTADGETYSAQTMPLVGTVVGAGYDQIGQVYYLCMYNAVTTVATLLVSSTGLTGSWTTAHTFITGLRVYSMGVCNGEIIVWAQYTQGFSGTMNFNNYTGLVSSDAGNTWRICNVLDTFAPGNLQVVRAAYGASACKAFLYSNSDSPASGTAFNGLIAATGFVAGVIASV